MATVALGQARGDELQRAAAEGARIYLLGGLGTLVGLVGVWALRRRPLVAAVVFVSWQAAVILPLRPRTTRLGLAYHGEFVLHHFTTLLAAAICVVLALDWIGNRTLPRWRLLPATLALLGTGLAAAAHLWMSRSAAGPAAIPGWAAPAPIALFAAWLALPAIAWRQLGPMPLRIAGLLIALPFVVRLLLGGSEALSGAVVPPPGRPWVMSAVVVSGAGLFVLARPRLSRGLWILVSLSSFVAVAMLYLVYRHGFGELEDDLGGLAISVFGFVPAYPSYVPAWQSVLVMLGLFGLFNAAYAGLIARDDRPRGVALSLIVVSGIGLTSPQLWLMAGAAGLLFLSTLIGEAAVRHPPPQPLEDVMRAAARRLGLPDPVVLETEDGAILSMRGELEARAIELRARPLPRNAWSVELRVGVQGRERAEIELVPDRGTDGVRPAHLLARTHTVRGDRRAAEKLDDELLDALVPLPGARVELWSAGARIDLGSDLSALDAKVVTRLARALTRPDATE